MLERMRCGASITAMVDGDALEEIKRRELGEDKVDYDYSLVHSDETVKEFLDHE